MSYRDRIQEHLIKNEEVICEGRPHKLPLITESIAVSFLLLVFQTTTIPFLGLWSVVLVNYMTAGLVLTNKRVLGQSGAFSRQSVDILLPKIEGISVDEGLFGRSLGCGTIIIRGTGGGKEKFKMFANPIEFSKRVHAEIDGSKEALSPK